MSDLRDFLRGIFTTDDGKIDWRKVLGTGAAGYGVVRALDATNNLEGIKNFLGLNEQNKVPVGYQGGIPRYTGVRQQVPMYFSTDQAAYDPNRRPGGGGRRYFTDFQRVPTSGNIPAAEAAADAEKWRLAAENLGSLGRETRPVYGQTNPQIQQKYTDIQALGHSPESNYREMLDYANRFGVGLGQLAQATGYPYADVQQTMRQFSGTATPKVPTTQQYDPQNIQNTLNRLMYGAEPAPTGMKMGGLASLNRKGMYLGGSTNGMADSIPATINGSQPAALSDGEFVIPADVVSAVGGGNSNAGAKQFYDMMDNIRRQAYGRRQQINPVNLRKAFPYAR